MQIRETEWKGVKNITNIILKLVILQTALFLWKQIVGLMFAHPGSFADKMITMSGMMILTLAVVIYSRIRDIKIPFFPERFSRKYVIGTVCAVAFLIATPSNYSDGIRGPLLLVYASLVTPLYEELLFRGYIWTQLEDSCTSVKQIAWVNAVLFSVWHLGYIIESLIAGEWMALSKLAIGLVYGIILCCIRLKTRNCYSGFWVHGVLNAFLG